MGTTATEKNKITPQDICLIRCLSVCLSVIHTTTNMSFQLSMRHEAMRMMQDKLSKSTCICTRAQTQAWTQPRPGLLVYILGEIPLTLWGDCCHKHTVQTLQIRLTHWKSATYPPNHPSFLPLFLPSWIHNTHIQREIQVSPYIDEIWKVEWWLHGRSTFLPLLLHFRFVHMKTNGKIQFHVAA